MEYFLEHFFILNSINATAGKMNNILNDSQHKNATQEYMLQQLKLLLYS